MAATADARQLTEHHRLAQNRLASHVAIQMLTAWQLLDPDDLDGSFERWLATTLPMVTAQRVTSARLAGAYLEVFKRLELGGAPDLPLVLDGTLDPVRFATSMLVTGPISIKKAMTRGEPLDKATDAALTRTTGAATRHVLDGGRGTIIRTVEADRQALGWARVTSGKPCYFCAMLASRGAVYRSKVTAGFEPHDGCNCEPEPLYRDDSKLPPGNEHWADLWQQAKAQSGDTTKNFRRLVEST